MKICAKCKTPKHESEFSKSSRLNKFGQPYLISYCKPCRRSMDGEYSKKPSAQSRKKKYRDENRRELNAKSIAKYHSKTLEEKAAIIARQTAWAKANPEKLKIYQQNQKNDIMNRVFKNLGKRIMSAADTKVKKCVGLSVEEFKSHIESQFRDGMTWENYGKTWHLDHIKPVVSFDLFNEKAFQELSHFSNIQPLLISENLKKGAK